MAGIAKLQLLIDIKEKLNVGLNAAKQKVAKATGDIQTKLDSLSVNSIKAFSAIKDEIPGAARAIELLSNPYTAAAAGAVAFGAGIAYATNQANQWREQIAQVNTTARLGKRDLGNLSDQLLNIGSKNANKLEEVPLAFNRIISAGLDTNTSLKTLEPTLRAAKARFTDVETAAAAATSVMMAAGVDANKTFDVLFATQRAGNAEFKDIAQYLPKVIPLAKNVGFGLEETAGAYAKLTATLRPEAASTALEGIYRAFSNPVIALGKLDKKTKQYIGGFKSIGVDIFDSTTGKARPLISILEDVSKSMSGLTDKQKMLKFGQLGLDQESSLGFSTLLQNMTDTKRIIGEVTNSQGEANRAFDAAKSPMDSWKIIINEVKVSIIKIGEIFLPIIQAAGEKVLGFIQYWKDLYNNSILFRDILSGISFVFSAMWSIAMIPLKNIITFIAFIWNELKNLGSWIENTLIKKIFGIEAGFRGVYYGIRPYLIYIKELMLEIAGIGNDIASGNITSAWNKSKNFKMPDLDKIRQQNKAYYINDVYEKLKQKENPKDNKGNNTPQTPTPDNTTYPPQPKSSIASDAARVKGGSQTKNITINIDSFIKGGLNPTHTSINSMSKDELERWLTEMFFRVIRSAETSS